MMMRIQHKFPRQPLNRLQQQGSALIVGLVFLVILTLLGLTASSGGIHQEMITRNIKDQNLASYLAEAALRDAETWLRLSGPLTPLDTAIIKNPGYCDNGNADCANQDTSWWDTNGETFGSLLNSAEAMNFASGAVSTTPKVVIELYRVKSSCPWCATTTIVNYYRITARATGIKPTTVRVLRSLYRW